MNSLNASLTQFHKPIIFSMLIVIVFFAAACTFHDTIPICHYLFGCDHHLHMTG